MNLKTLGVAAALLGAMAVSAHAAGPVGTQGIVDLGPTSADTSNILTATSFSLGDLLSTGNHTGIFDGLSNQDFGAVTFSTTSGLMFTSTEFGTFDGTSVSLQSKGATSISYYVLGDWTHGSHGGVTGGPYPSSFTISFTQTGGAGGAISDSGTFAVPPSGTVPEPATWAMLGLGFAALGFAASSRGRRDRILAA